MLDVEQSRDRTQRSLLRAGQGNSPGEFRFGKVNTAYIKRASLHQAGQPASSGPACIKRASLTVRMHLRRCARRTNARREAEAALSSQRLACCVGVGRMRRCGAHPAIELACHIGSIGELVREAQAAPPLAPTSPPHPSKRTGPETVRATDHSRGGGEIRWRSTTQLLHRKNPDRGTGRPGHHINPEKENCRNNSLNFWRRAKCLSRPLSMNGSMSAGNMKPTSPPS